MVVASGKLPLSVVSLWARSVADAFTRFAPLTPRRVRAPIWAKTAT